MLSNVANGAQREVLLWILCLKKSGPLMGGKGREGEEIKGERGRKGEKVLLWMLYLYSKPVAQRHQMVSSSLAAVPPSI